MASSSMSKKKRKAEDYLENVENEKKKLRPSTGGERRTTIRAISASKASSELKSKLYRLCKVRLEILFGAKKYNPGKAEKDIPVVDSIALLNFDNNWRIWFEYHEFSNIQSLDINCSLYTIDLDTRNGRDFDLNKSNVAENLSAIFSGMNNLKHLSLRCEIPNDTVNANFELESAEVFCILPFIESSAKTLKRLKLLMLNGFAGYQLKIHDLQDLFSRYEKLEDFAGVLHFHKEDLQKQLLTSVTILNLDIHVLDKDTKESDLTYLEYILTSTPLLESLTMYAEITPSFINYLVKNMLSLKKVIACGGISKEALMLFDEIKKNNSNTEVMNTKFLITVANGRNWKKNFS